MKAEEQFIIKTPESMLKAIEYYKQALKIDPNFSRAYADLGITYQISSNLGYHREMKIDGATIRLLARNYLELAMQNPTPEAYSLAAIIELHRRNFQKSISFAEKASSYAPNSADRLTGLAWMLTHSGREEEAIELLNRAIRLDPLDTRKHTPICYIGIGVSHFSMGNLEEAVTFLKKGLSLNPELTNYSCFLAASHALLDHDSEARKALAEYLKKKSFTPNIQFLYYSWPFRDSRVFDRLAQGLVKAGMQGDPDNYYRISEENKLNDKEIDKLLFGKTYSGYVWGNKSWVWSTTISDTGEVQRTVGGKNATGKAWIDDNKICWVSEKYYGGLKSCGEVYRNPEGDQLTKTKYITVYDFGQFPFSVKKCIPEFSFAFTRRHQN
jgi:tetratricopeptide (TPR) repeat protein